MGNFQDAYKISSADRSGKGVTGLPDTPGLSTGDMQARFDSLANLAIDKFNAVVEAVETVFTVEDAAIFATQVRIAADADGRIDAAIAEQGFFLFFHELLHADGVHFVFLHHVEHARDAGPPVVRWRILRRTDVEGGDAEDGVFLRQQRAGGQHDE